MAPPEARAHTGYRLYGLENLQISTKFEQFWGLFNASVQNVFPYDRWTMAVNSRYLP